VNESERERDYGSFCEMKQGGGGGVGIGGEKRGGCGGIKGKKIPALFLKGP